MKRAVIFLNGNKPPRSLVFTTIKTTDTIICADGGAKHAVFFGFTPHVIVGDLDSLPHALQKKLKELPIEWVTFSSEKDFTDSELAIKYALKKGFREIVVIGVMGDRIDHVLANITFFVRLVRENNDLALRIVDEKQSLYFVREKLALSGKKGQTISILSVDGDAKSVSTTGLKWKLDNETLHFGEPRGISNVFNGTKAMISVKKGVLLVVVQR